MSKHVSDLPAREEMSENTEQRIKEHLKSIVPEHVYEKWIDRFVFEKIDKKKIIIGYYGGESIKEFEKNYGEQVWLGICSVVGYSKKMKIRRRKSKAPEFNTEKRKNNITAAKWFALSLVFSVITLITALLAGNYIANRNFTENFYSVSSSKANNHMRIMQISDLHGSAFGSNNKKLTERAAKLKPDLILLTGDCLDSSAASTKTVVDLCAELAQTAPTYYIYGNNEVKRIYDVPLLQEQLDKKFGFNDENRDPSKLTEQKDDFEKELEKNGVKVLKNESDTITVGLTKVDIYGVLTSNPSSFWSYAGESFNEYLYNNTNNLKITAVHEPLIFEEYSPDTWGDLLVCGHTHGGFARVPKLGGVYTHEGGLFPERSGKYVYGRYDVAGSPLIVSSGMANGNILRVNNPPELVIIDVNKF